MKCPHLGVWDLTEFAENCDRYGLNLA
jgi:hypothetical protein